MPLKSNVKAHLMAMDQAQIDGVAGVLQRWNPLGAAAGRVVDLNGYETEAIDIIANLILGRQSPEHVVRTVINQAFDINVSVEECLSPTAEIVRVLK
jgi:hypothetical protein